MRHRNTYSAAGTLLTCIAVLFCAVDVGFHSAHAQQTEAALKEFLENKIKAEKGDALAQLTLGVCYFVGQSGVERDYSEAVKWYRKAAEQNHPGAQHLLGLCYKDGLGVVKDKVEALKWYRKAADQNLAQAQNSLADLYCDGIGADKNFTEAVKWYRKAADQNYVDAQFSLGLCYSKGRGLEKDYVEAVKWYRKAAEQNYIEAQNNLGLCYANGHGVAKDEVQGYAWLNLAAKTYDLAAQNRDNLEKIMSPQQVADAQKRTKELRARIDARFQSGGK